MKKKKVRLRRDDKDFTEREIAEQGEKNHLIFLVVSDPAHQVRQILIEHSFEVTLYLAECHDRI